MVDVSAFTCLMAIEDEKNVAPLVEYLRSGKPIDQQFRNRLANLLDGNAPGNIKLVAERRKGKPSKDIGNDYDIGCWIFSSISEGKPDKAAIEDAMIEFSIGKTKAYDCLKLYKDVELSKE